ncbi:fimbrial protein [Morganella morganii]|uniref:fimbrial protein n=1 Tax=Morganella morganii TaxID=582 RepID=UPI001BDB7EB0|nr:fimbrial protein [Morganella morganii]MBT0462940.1 type 1 fimbrial protein [Morganella morganii subsp. morganii]
MESSEVYKSYIKDIDMNKMKLALLVSGALVAGVSTSALALQGDSQGTVTFKGKLITETCHIEGQKDQTVILDAVSIKTLDAANKEGGFKNFNIIVNCPDAKTEFEDVGIHFEPVGQTTAWDSSTGNLENAWVSDGTPAQNLLSAAQNVQIKIYNTNDSQTNHAKIGEVSKWMAAAAPGVNTFTYAGGYYATDATTPGEVFARVQYTLVYQ